MPFSRTWWDVRRTSRPFLASTAIIVLLAVYSALAARSGPSAPGDPGTRQHGAALHRRAREASATGQECRDVHLVSDQCTFILTNCGDDEAGLLHYLTFYYCTLGASGATKGVAFAILTAWLGLLFTTIGIAASDFFSVNLSTIAGVLGLSESLAGVTFLAFGNGSPDVFSTFAAMGSNSGSMAVGELIGAASFITAVVAGSMALVREFKVSRRTFVRDVCFFIVAVSFAMVFLADGQLRLWECCVMIGFYLFYVVTVVTWHWYSTRRRRRRLKDAAARGHFYAVGGQSRDELEPYRDDPDEDEAAPMGGRRSSAADGTDISALERGPRIEVDGAGLQHPSPDEDEDANRHITAEMTSSMRVNRPRWSRSNTTTITPIRPSLVGALEFRSILSSLHKERNMHLHSLPDRMNTDIVLRLPPQHNRTTSLGMIPERVVIVGTAVEPSTPTRRSIRDRALSSGDRPLNLENDSLDSPTRPQAPPQPNPSITSADGRLAPPPDPLLLPPGSDPGLALALPPPHRPRQQLQLQIPSPSGGSSGRSSPSLSISPFPGLSESPLPLSTPPPPLDQQEGHTRYPFPAVPDLRRSSLLVLDESVEFPKPVKWWPYQLLPPPHILFGTLFPTLQGWREKSVWDKIISLISVPSIFVLVATLPVVETETPEEDSDITPVGDSAEDVAHAASDVSSEAPMRQNLEWQEYQRRKRANTASRSPLLLSPALIAVDAVAATERRNGSDESAQAAGDGSVSATAVTPGAPAKAGSLVSMEESQGWSRWLVVLQIFMGPLFVVSIVWANMADELQNPAKDLVRAVMSALVFSLVALGVLLLTTTPDRKPKYHFLLCFLGFVISVAWISTVAGEVVGVLKAFGVILGISDAILGLTIFAVGNSLGDLVADVTVARLGYPVMALAACFGGPMLNILLGVGIGGAWMSISTARAKHKKHPDRPLHYKPYHIQVGGTLIISAVTVLLTLLILLIVVPYNKWVMSRKIGWGLIAIWTVSTIVNLVVELTGVWEDVS